MPDPNLDHLAGDPRSATAGDHVGLGVHATPPTPVGGGHRISPVSQSGVVEHIVSPRVNRHLGGIIFVAAPITKQFHLYFSSPSRSHGDGRRWQ